METTTMEGKNRRATYFKIKVFITIIAVVVVVAYMRNHRNMFSKLGMMKSETVHTIRDSVGRRLSDRTFGRDLRKPLYRDSLSHAGRVENAGNNLAPKNPLMGKMDDLNDNRKNWIEDKSKDEETESKDRAGESEEEKEQPYSTAHAENNTVNKVVNTVPAATMKVKEIPPGLAKDTLSKKIVNESTTALRKKITFKKIAGIASEILDRLNISKLKTAMTKINETNSLTHAAVGNLSKEILKQNLSRTIAMAVIMILSRGNGSGQNITLGKQLWRDYVNNTQPLRVPEYPNNTEKTRYVDKYQKVDGASIQKIQAEPPQQRYGQVNRADIGNPRPIYRDSLQQGGQPPRDRDGRLPVPYEKDKYQLKLRDEKAVPKYRDNRDDPKNMENREYRGTQQQLPRYREGQQKDYVRVNNNRQIDKESKQNADLMQREETLNKREDDQEQHTQYKDNTQQKILMDHRREKREVPKIESKKKFDNLLQTNIIRADVKRSIADIEPAKKV